VAGLSIGAALLSIPITGLRFVANVTAHLIGALASRLRAMIEVDRRPSISDRPASGM
jgi:hypothetical protein